MEAEGESKHFAEVAYDNQATPNNGMHPTADTTALMFSEWREAAG
jgi:hypothetical protein